VSLIRLISLAVDARYAKLEEALKKCLEALDQINCGVHDADAEFLARASARAALAAAKEGK
jgi:hypothetical protein